MPATTVSLGPIVSEVSRLFDYYTSGPSMCYEFEPDTTTEMFAAQIDAVEASGISVKVYNELLRTRTGGRWLNDNGCWAILPEWDEADANLEEA